MARAQRGASLRRFGAYAAAVGAAYVAVQGGEYSTTDLVRQWRREVALVASVDSLRRDVDSLRTLQKRLENDRALQERVAREEHGFVRGDKELVYRFVDPPSARNPE